MAGKVTYTYDLSNVPVISHNLEANLGYSMISRCGFKKGHEKKGVCSCVADCGRKMQQSKPQHHENWIQRYRPCLTITLPLRGNYNSVDFTQPGQTISMVRVKLWNVKFHACVSRMFQIPSLYWRGKRSRI